jgi:von Willebrand factor type A domain
MKFWRKPSAVDSYDARALRTASFRARFLRVSLAAAALALLGFATASARGLEAGNGKLLPGSSGVLVLDLSLSIGDKDYAAIREVVRRLIDEHGTTGLVIFSDVPYELLPPGTPATELRPLLRLLVPHHGGPPVTPWSQNFRAGTRISSALDLAREMLASNGVKNGSILLVSDLITAPEDIPQLVRTLQELRRDSITLRAVPVSTYTNSRPIFNGLLGPKTFISPSQLKSSHPLRSLTQGVALPIGFLVLGSLVLAVLAVHERFTGRLGLPAAEGTRS